MQLLVRSAMIFFGTLMAAGLVALGEPSAAHVPDVAKVAPVVQQLFASAGAQPATGARPGR